MLVEMRTTAAGPDFVLDAGKAYNLPRNVAERFLKGGFAKPAKSGAKLTRIPPQPDPEDTPAIPTEEEVTETDEDEDDE